MSAIAAEETAETTPQTPADADSIHDKYADIPFDDSRVVKYGETPGWEVLRRKADEIATVDADIRALVADMGDIMYRAHGVGLAAPQIGRSVRLLVYDAGEGLKALINPVIVKKRGEQFEPEEGCLSIPGLRGVVPRAQDITVKALDGDGSPVRFRATEFESRVIQHEIDHLDGILFVDLADPKSLHMVSEDDDADEAPAE